MRCPPGSVILLPRVGFVSELIPKDAVFEKEKQELEVVLASEGLRRAPTQAQVLAYLCARYFEGTADHVKEYTIAVEALGRPSHFNQKTDASVRVAVHELRRRLREYYATDGADHPVQIQIPSGQYKPLFVWKDSGFAANRVESELLREPQRRMLAPWGWRRSQIQWAAAVLAVLVAASVISLVSHRTRMQALELRQRRANAAMPVATTAVEDIRIMAGVESGEYIDSFGHLWQNDRYFNGGTRAHGSTHHAIAGTLDSQLYQNWREGSFSYDIPLKPGVYELRLHFAETIFGEGNVGGGGETSREFDIRINGKMVARAFDVVANAGANAASILVFKDLSPMADGRLHIQCIPFVSAAFLNGLEVTPGTPGSMRPIRLVARDRAYTDKEGHYWLPDRFATGGRLLFRTPLVANTSSPELYQGERFGNFSYQIPVAPGEYRLNLYLSERWFGPGKPGGGGAGDRLMNMFCNGVALLKHFDIYRQAGGADRAVTMSFRHLKPNAQGRLDLSFIPEANYACVNALDIIDEAGDDNPP